MPGTGVRPRGRDPKARLRSSFLNHAVQHVEDLAALLLGVDVDRNASVSDDLAAMADTASSLGLDSICEAADEASRKVAAGESGQALRDLARVIRGEEVVPLFPPIAVVAAGNARNLFLGLEGRADEILFVPTIEELRERYWFQDVQAAIVPVKPRRALKDLAESLPGRVYAWGPQGDARKFLSAARDGAAGYLGVPANPEAILERIRVDTQRRVSSAPRVLVAARSDELWDELGWALSRHRLQIGRVSTVAELAPMLDRFSPSLLAVVGEVEGASALEIGGIVRNHERCFHAQILVACTGREDASTLRGVADEVVGLDAGSEAIAEGIRARLERPGGSWAHRDPLTWLPNRPLVLGQLDAEMARSRRSGAPLCVALVDVDGLKDVNAQIGRMAGDEGLRLLAEVLRTGVRAYDLVGRLGSDGFLVAMPGCTAPAALPRLAELQGNLRERCAADPRFAGLTFSAGVADSEYGLATVVCRADRVLARIRAARVPGTVESDR